MLNTLMLRGSFPGIDQPTLEGQLAAEREQNQSPYLADMAFSIIARKAQVLV